MTATKFPRWLALRAAEIDQTQQLRAKRIADGVAQCLCNSIRIGMTLDAAGDDLIRRFPYGGCVGDGGWTPGELKAELIRQGWQPKARRGQGGAA